MGKNKGFVLTTSTLIILGLISMLGFLHYRDNPTGNLQFDRGIAEVDDVLIGILPLPARKSPVEKCPQIVCVQDSCPGRHIPDENGCVHCASPCVDKPSSECYSDGDCPIVTCQIGPCPTNKCINGRCELTYPK